METNELREILKLYGLQHDVVINKSSRRYSIILDNNIIRCLSSISTLMNNKTIHIINYKEEKK